MNINENFSSEQPKFSNEIMTLAMQEIHDILIEPMTAKPDANGFIKTKPLTPEQDSMLAIVGLSFKVMAEKATQLEKMEQGFQGNFINEGDFNRN